MKKLSYVSMFIAAATLLVTTSVSCQREMRDSADWNPSDDRIAFSPSLGQFAAENEGVGDIMSLGTRSVNGAPRKLFLHGYSETAPVSFSEKEGESETKSAPVTVVHSTFKVSGYAFLGSWNDQNKANLFFGETMAKSGSTWTGEAQMVWPGADYNVRFGAVSPATATNLSWTSTALSEGMPAYSYTVAGTAASQVDILECASANYLGDGSTAGSGVALTFSHALTGVKFRTNDFGTAGTVKSVSIEGVYNSGSHVVGASSWTGLSGDAVYSFPSINAAFTASGESAVTDGANTLLLMPQTCPAGAKIVISMTINGTDWDLEASIAGHIWEPGKMITYTISPSEDDWLFSMVDLSSVPESVTSGSATNVATVKSFRQHALGFKEALPWTVQYSTDGGSSYSGTKPSWLTAISPVSGDGGWAGETINATATRASNAEHRVKVKVCNSGDSKTFDIVIPKVLTGWSANTDGTFGGLHISPMPLYYNGTSFELRTEDEEDNNVSSYNSKYGKVAGSYYFNFVELGSYFDADGSSFSTSSGDIDNTNKISYDGHNDWRLPTRAEWCTLTTGAEPGTSREGSSVNGNTGSKYALIKLTGATHATASNPNGLLLFPDGETITGKALSGINNTTQTTGVTLAELQAYLDQGCAFLPASGHCYNGSWYNAGSYGNWWSSTQNDASFAYNLDFNSSSLDPSNYSNKSNLYFPVRLVR